MASRFPEIIARLDAAAKAGEAAAAEIVANAAKERVPVQTGKLRDAIHVQDDPDGTYVVAGTKAIWYGHIVEHGSIHMAAHPFLVPALEENREIVQNTISEAIRRAL